MFYILGFIFLAHGFIHLAGFTTAFNYWGSIRLNCKISKPLGRFWFIAFLFFFTSFILLFLGKPAWALTSIVSVLLSQILIVSVWKVAKMGTLLNLIILLAAIPFFGNMLFVKNSNELSANLLGAGAVKNRGLAQMRTATALPPIIQQWMLRSGVINHAAVFSVRSKQKGQMRLKPDGKWLDFEAEEYFTPLQPAYIWSTKVSYIPGIYFNGMDKWQDGEGSTVIKALSVFNVVNQKGGEKLNQGSMLRYLAEITLFPSAALSPYITWQAVDSISSVGTLNYKGSTVSGLFVFTQKGDFVSFLANRYFGSGANATLEKWQIETLAYKAFHGVTIPYKTKVSWLLSGGEFNWLNLEITDIEYNNTSLYNNNLN